MKIKNIQEYILKVIGIELEISPLNVNLLNKLNFHQRGLYDYYYTQIEMHDFILLISKSGNQSPYEIKKIFDSIRHKLNKELIFVKNKINSYDRMRLIKYKVGFIIINKHLYIPNMFIDLRESFNIEPNFKEKFTPSTQFLLIFHLLKSDINEKTSNEIKSILDKVGQNADPKYVSYSRMTINRTLNELKKIGICKINHKKGKKYLILSNNKRGLFIKSRKFMINPISKSLKLFFSPDKLNLKLYSKTTALSKYSMISPDNIITHAIYKKKFKKMYLDADESDLEYFNLELWQYNPLILSLDGKNVDPISLYLSLKDNKDERIVKALKNMVSNKIW